MLITIVYVLIIQFYHLKPFDSDTKSKVIINHSAHIKDFYTKQAEKSSEKPLEVRHLKFRVNTLRNLKNRHKKVRTSEPSARTQTNNYFNV